MPKLILIVGESDNKECLASYFSEQNLKNRIPNNLEDSVDSFVERGELLVKKSLEPFNNSLNQLPEIHWAEPPEPPRKPLTVEDVVEISQALRVK